MDLGKYIKKIRKDSGLTQKELADRIYVTQHTISQYENSTRDIKFTMLQDIMDAIGYKINFKKGAFSNMELKQQLPELIDEIEDELKNEDICSIILNEDTLLVVETNNYENIISVLKESMFICHVSEKFCDLTKESISEHIETMYNKKMNSIEFKIINGLEIAFNGYFYNIDYSTDIINDYLYINKVKVCRLDNIVEIFTPDEESPDSIRITLLDRKTIHIIIEWPKNSVPYICQIYKTHTEQEEFYSDSDIETIYDTSISTFNN